MSDYDYSEKGSRIRTLYMRLGSVEDSLRFHKMEWAMDDNENEFRDKKIAELEAEHSEIQAKLEILKNM